MKKTGCLIIIEKRGAGKEQHMTFLNRLGDTITSVGKDVTQKAKDVSGIAKLKMDIRSREDFVKEQYIQIGKAYYQAHKGEDVPEKDRFDRIDEALDEIARMELQILELKKARKCPKCGAEASDTAEFCSVCGTKLGVVVADAEAKDAKEPTEEKEEPVAEAEEKTE